MKHRMDQAMTRTGGCPQGLLCGVPAQMPSGIGRVESQVSTSPQAMAAAVVKAGDGHMCVREMWAAAGIAVVIVLTLPACTSSSTPGGASTAGPTETSSSPSPSGSVTDPNAEAITGALRAYEGFWDAKVATLRHPKHEDPELRTYAIDKALTDTRATALLYARNGITRKGEPERDPKATVEVLEPTPRVVIVDCVDASDWIPRYAATGKSALAPGQPLRVVVDSTAQLYEGRWVIRTSVSHRDKPC